MWNSSVVDSALELNCWREITMGGFYGGVFLRTGEREKVKQIVENVARKHKCRFLVGPALRGWVGVYPSDHGQDQRVSRSIARCFRGDLFHLLVHDDDVFCYDFYRNSRLVDRYNSCPDYFGATTPKEKDKMRGRPERFADVLADCAHLEELDHLLHAREPGADAFVSATMERFARQLDIANAVTSYEYLMREETDGIEGWDQFVHVPDRSAEQAQQKAVETALVAEEQRLLATGLLLFRKRGPVIGRFASAPVGASDHTGTGFLLAWSNHASDKPSSLKRYARPWSAGGNDTGITLASTCWDAQTNRSGRYVAVGHAAGNWKAEVWDLDTKALVREIPHSRAVSVVGFMPDGMTLVTRSDEEIILTPLEGTSIRHAMPGNAARRAHAIHPSGEYLLLDHPINKLALLNLKSGQIERILFLGGRRDFTALTTAMSQRLDEYAAALDWEALEQHLAKEFEQADLNLKNEAGRSLREHFEQMKETWRKMAASEGIPDRPDNDDAVQGSEQATRLLFSPDGARVFCASNRGVRVFAWDKILGAQDAMPRPEISLDSGFFDDDTDYGVQPREDYVYGLVHDTRNERLLFGGLSGVVRFLDLPSGESGDLCEFPGRPAILDLILSRDGSALCCLGKPDFYDRSNRPKPYVAHIWDYAKIAR
jgi:WD40 repeat protein